MQNGRVCEGLRLTPVEALGTYRPPQLRRELLVLISFAHLSNQNMNQRENASPLRRLIGPLLLVLCGSLHGCALPYETARVFDLAKRTTHVEPRFFEYIKSDRLAQREARLLADQAWAEVMHTVPVVTPDYHNGFTEGFADYLYRGGSGEIPLVPPRGYWKLRFLNPRGKMAIEEWYAGFKHGVQDCQTRGIRDMWVVPTSYVSDSGSKDSGTNSGSIPTSEAELWSASESLMLGDPSALNQSDAAAKSDEKTKSDGPQQRRELLATPEGADDGAAGARNDQDSAEGDLDVEADLDVQADRNAEDDEASSLEFREMLEAATPSPSRELDGPNKADELDLFADELPADDLPTDNLPTNELPGLDVSPIDPDSSNPFSDDVSDPFTIPGDDQPPLDFDPGDLMEGDDDPVDPFSSRRGNVDRSVASADKSSKLAPSESNGDRSFFNRLRTTPKQPEKVAQPTPPRELPLKLVAEARPVKSATPADDAQESKRSINGPNKVPPMKLVAEATDATVPSGVTTASANMEIPVDGNDSLSEISSDDSLLPIIPLQVAPRDPPDEVWVVPNSGTDSEASVDSDSAVNRWDAWSPQSSDSVEPERTWTTEEDRLGELPLRVDERSREMPRITIPDPAKLTQPSGDSADAQTKRFLNFEGPQQVPQHVPAQDLIDELGMALSNTAVSVVAAEEHANGVAKSPTTSRRTEPPLKVEVRNREVHLRSKSGNQRWALD